MWMAFMFQVCRHKPKHWTSLNVTLRMALDEKVRGSPTLTKLLMREALILNGNPSDSWDIWTTVVVLAWLKCYHNVRCCMCTLNEVIKPYTSLFHYSNWSIVYGEKHISDENIQLYIVLVLTKWREWAYHSMPTPLKWCKTPSLELK